MTPTAWLLVWPVIFMVVAFIWCFHRAIALACLLAALACEIGGGS